MNIFLDNVKLDNTGKGNFATHLTPALQRKGCKISNDFINQDIQLSFIRRIEKTKLPMVQRLDGIHFNSRFNYTFSNAKIKDTYKNANHVIFQSIFCKKVVTNFFGAKESNSIIYNGTNLDKINGIKPRVLPDIKLGSNWICASRWKNRPNKRLWENISYFLAHKRVDDRLFIAGEASFEEEKKLKLYKKDNIVYLGAIDWSTLISLCKICEYFIHLAIVDPCPNVVVDAVACGCKIVCSDLGGTNEIVGNGSIIIKDMDWDYKTPFDYKNPPKLNYQNVEIVKNKPDMEFININNTANDYIKVFEKVLGR